MQTLHMTERCISLVRTQPPEAWPLFDTAGHQELLQPVHSEGHKHFSILFFSFSPFPFFALVPEKGKNRKECSRRTPTAHCRTGPGSEGLGEFEPGSIARDIPPGNTHCHSDTRGPPGAFPYDALSASEFQRVKQYPRGVSGGPQMAHQPRKAPLNGTLT